MVTGSQIIGFNFCGFYEKCSNLWEHHCVHSGFSSSSTVNFLFFQNNLNLLRDIAVLIARDFKSKPAPKQLFVLHRYGGAQGRGANSIPHILWLLDLSHLVRAACFLKGNVNKENRILNCLGLLQSCVIKGICNSVTKFFWCCS